jgi:hypothetical protein
VIRLLFPLVLAGISASAHAGPDERVAEIRGWYASIGKAKPAKERTIAFEDTDTPFSGDLVVRDYEGGLQSMVISYAAGDHSALTEHFYLKDGRLFFAYVVACTWRFAEGSTDENPKTEDTRTEDRFYYDDAVCIRRLTRSATAVDAENLAEITAKLEPREVPPGEDAKDHLLTVEKLLKAKTGTDVLRAYESE